MKPIRPCKFIAYATPAFFKYVDAAEQVAASLGMECAVAKVKDRPTFAGNVNMKPTTILAHLEEVDLVAYRDQMWIYTDVDNEWYSVPMVDADLDIGLVENPNPMHKNVIAASVIVLKPTSRHTYDFVRRWVQKCNTEPQRNDHPLFVETLMEYHRNMPDGMRIVDCPQFNGHFAQNGRDEEKPSYRKPFNLDRHAPEVPPS